MSQSGKVCVYSSSSVAALLLAAIAGYQLIGSGNAQTAPRAGERRTVLIKRDPVRELLEDPFSNFSGMAIDEEKGELFLSNDNERKGQSIETYHVEFPAERSDRVMEPLRMIAGPKADLGDICGIAISTEFNEIYKVSGEGNSELGVFPLNGNGDMEAVRWLPTSHGAWGVFYDKPADELFVTIEHVNRVAVYKRNAGLKDEATRFIQGPKTQMADPHGIFVDEGRNEVYVANHGHWHETAAGEVFLQEGSVPPELKGKRKSYFDLVRNLEPSSGKFQLPSITVYARNAHGDVAPLRVIQGPKTGLNLPMGVVYDDKTKQIVVANGGDDRVLFFPVDSSGDVAPARFIGGNKTEIASPTAVVVDTKRNEIWVSNWGNHTATVFPRLASGNIAPSRVIRSAPKGSPRSGFGSPGTVAYNPKRDEILVPN
jgi:DNA-binding beta-propeller fold protein YncE